MQRRKFLRNTVAGGLGLAMARPQSLFAGTAAAPAALLQSQPGPCLLKGKTDDLKLNTADTSMFGFLNSFGTKAFLTGGCIASKLAKGNYRVSHIVAQISNFDNYRSFVTQRAALTGNGMSSGNTHLFQLPADDFRARSPAAGRLSAAAGRDQGRHQCRWHGDDVCPRGPAL
ncbi:MAG: hypothetical protein WDN28_08450 [Chthoniobacter sp.]